VTGKKLRAFNGGKFMKKYLTSVLLVVSAAVTIAATPEKTSFTVPMKPKQAPKAVKPPPLQPQETRGVLVRAFSRGHNPVQMLNPKANPAKYGTSQEHVAYDPYTGKPMGIKLLEFVF
jgi:hypothetical protein